MLGESFIRPGEDAWMEEPKAEEEKEKGEAREDILTVIGASMEKWTSLLRQDFEVAEIPELDADALIEMGANEEQALDILRFVFRDEEGEVKTYEIEERLLRSSLPVSLRERLRRKLRPLRKKLTKEAVERVISRAEREYERMRVEPNEAVGIVAAQSIGEPGTQMSLPGWERILLLTRGGEAPAEEKRGSEERLVVREIGDFVDACISKFGAIRIGDAEVCDLVRTDAESDATPFVLSLDKDGRLRWKRVKSCIRHKFSGELLRIRTKSGREITATPFHSFVTKKDGEIVAVAGSTLKVGDKIPVLRRLPLNCVSAVEDRELQRVSERASSDDDRTGTARKVVLSEEIGYAVGRYIAEYLEVSDANGLLSSFVLSADVGFLCGLLRGLFSLKKAAHVDEGVELSMPTRDLRDILSLLLARFGVFSLKRERRAVEEEKGEEGAEKREEYLLVVPREEFERLEKFLHFSGVNCHPRVACSPRCAFTARFAVFACALQAWLGSCEHPQQSTHTEPLSSPSERHSHNEDMRLVDCSPLHSFEANLNIFPQFSHNLKLVAPLRKIYVEGGECAEKAVSEGVEDVVWDEIERIEAVKCENSYVYDISVEGLETFTTFDGVITHNTMRTFHYAGVGALYVTMGLPRIIEIMDARKKPSTPTMKIKLESEYAFEREKAEEVAAAIEETRVQDIASVRADLDERCVLVSLREERLEERRLRREEVLEKLKKMGVEMDVQENLIRIYPKEESYYELLSLEKKIANMLIKGIEGIKRVLIRKDEDGEYALFTEGSALRKVMRVEGVDFTRTTTNNIIEIAEVLGIEAARNAIIEEILSTLEEQGLDVDPRHISLIADAMTMDGEVKQIGRHGLAGEKASVLSRAAFEVTVEHLLDAALRGERDELQGITENVIVGQPIRLGTGAVELVAKPFSMHAKQDKKGNRGERGV